MSWLCGWMFGKNETELKELREEKLKKIEKIKAEVYQIENELDRIKRETENKS